MKRHLHSPSMNEAEMSVGVISGMHQLSFYVALQRAENYPSPWSEQIGSARCIGGDLPRASSVLSNCWPFASVPRRSY